jgi:hypothetical protein
MRHAACQQLQENGGVFRYIWVDIYHIGIVPFLLLEFETRWNHCVDWSGGIDSADDCETGEMRRNKTFDILLTVC